ncbi:MAG: ABC transporter permease [Chloroflexi bacterium]|nr:ABC transporter permease [Chloroflexota bacterium]
MAARIIGQVLVPAGAILLALVVGAVVLLISSPLVTGRFDPLLPLATYAALVQGSLGSFNGIVDTIVNATPLILVGLAVGLCFRAGLFNIGGQGQFYMGALAAAAVGAGLAGSPPIVAVPLAVLAAAVAGAIYGFIPGVLKAFAGAHEVVTTIMLNYIAGFIISWAVQGPLRAQGASFARSPDVGNAMIPVVLNQGTGHEGHLGIILPVIAIVVIWRLLFRTTIGFEIRTVGANPDAARYAGMRPRLLTIFALTVGGMMAGLAGATEILGVTGYMAATYSTNIGFEAITVALLGRANPVGILFAGLLLGAMRAGSGLMQIEAGVPVQMVDLLQGVILLFLAADVIVRRAFRIRAATGAVTEVADVTRSYAGKSPAAGA